MMPLLMVPTGFEHGRYQAFMIVTCAALFPDLVWTGPVTLNFDDKLNPEPDVIGWKDGNPFIVIEIANTTQAADLGYKKSAYQANGVPFYAVLDTKSKSLYTWGVEKDGRYGENPDFLMALKDKIRERI